MIIYDGIQQNPAPGQKRLLFQGDILSFRLTPPKDAEGTAWLRTNIGRAKILREERLRSVHENLPPLGRGWFDLQMARGEGNVFEITLPLCEVGHFEAKCFFLKKDQPDPLWPPGDNTVINVEPADTCCGNIIYNAFVRQFGPNKSGNAEETAGLKKEIQALDDKGYTVIPPSGTFRDLIAELDFIMGHLGCRIIQLLPIHPTPTTYARMGRFGSPYAALSFTGIDPALAQFDPHATPLEQFTELVDAVHLRHGKLILDIAINHTGWAAGLHETHPKWLDRAPDGRINVPGAWGVRWEDLTKLDYRHKDLWRYMANVFLTWCRRGVDGFRCDAGYMIPVPTWKYILSKVREQYPGTVFFLEGLGGKISVTRAILNVANFNWAYSELFQNYTRRQIEQYLPESIQISREEGITVHYAETHDNLRLAEKSRTYARLRTDLCALFAPNGAFGFANGVEWLATEKIIVHQASSLNWNAADNQVDNIRRLTTLLKHHPAFHDQSELRLVQTGQGNHVALLRRHPPTGKTVLVVANLAEEADALAPWLSSAMPEISGHLLDLITGESLAVTDVDGNPAARLGPGQVACLSPNAEDLIDLNRHMESIARPVPRIVHQRLRTKALEIFCAYFGLVSINGFDPDAAARGLAEDPEAFCRHLNPHSDEPRVISWHWPQDVRRVVMVPPKHFLLVKCSAPFRARIMNKERTIAQEESLQTADGAWFALFMPLPPSGNHVTRSLHLSVYKKTADRPKAHGSGGKENRRRCAVYKETADHSETPLLLLAEPETLFVQRALIRSDLGSRPRMLLLTNGRGAMCHTPLLWGQLQSRYDALLAANLNSNHPVDRWIMFTRCRAWVVYQGFSQEITFDCFHSFHVDNQGRGLWRFHIPTGQGEHIRLTVRVEMPKGKNAVTLTFYRHPSAKRHRRLTDDQPVRLILRPDLEHRSFHAATKAYMGPETQWPAAVFPRANGFSFAPESSTPLFMHISAGAFFIEPEWHYMVHLPKEAQRGFEPNTDLFSPGYFTSELAGDAAVILWAGAPAAETPDAFPMETSGPLIDETLHEKEKPARPLAVITAALSDFTVNRGQLKTVIAGYPWFLDWGRDALIFTRGLIAAGNHQAARGVLYQFGRFEKNGTLPNMIQGAEAANRDTSDAPLWFMVAVADLIAEENARTFLDTVCANRSILEILISIANAYISGTPNGIRMDPGSGLIFSPGHFTWMDTNHPAGTPRQGYPIEIQALWFHALDFLDRMDPASKKNRWRPMAKQVKRSITDLFFLNEAGFLSDCRHAPPGTAAVDATPDDALRPNQLLAVSLGAVTQETICRRILRACETLLVPGAIRSLGDRPVQHALPVVHNGTALNDPHRPYIGRYEGDEDTRRKPAYHNGTAWTWPFPSYCEAWAKVYGKKAVNTAKAWLGSSSRILEEGCFGQVPEILDGDAPHAERGCDAQAWGASEWVRVWNKLDALAEKAH